MPFSRKALLLLLLISLSSQACRFSIGFRQGKEDSSLETIAIQAFGNDADLVVPSLAQNFTERLQDEFLSRSRLSLTNDQADVTLSGSVINYSITPAAIAGNETAAQNRLTIAIRVKYENRVDESQSWENTFTKFSDFDANQNFAAVEEMLIEEVVDQLVVAIFNQVFGNW
jgi:hypothetical protein